MCACVRACFHVDLRTNSDYLPVQRYLTAFHNSCIALIALHELNF